MENGQTSVQQLNILYIEKNNISKYGEVDIKSAISLFTFCVECTIVVLYGRYWEHD